MNKKIHQLFYGFILLIFIGNFNTSIEYFLLAIMGTLVIMYAIINHFNVSLIVENNFLEYIPIILLLLWFYGFMLGLIKGNELEYIIRNFAGMVVYVVFYFMQILRVDRKTILNVVYKLSVFSALISSFAYLDKFLFKTNYIGMIPILNNFRSGGSNILYANQLLIFSLIFFSFYKIYVLKVFKFSDVFLFLLGSVDIFFVIKQGGFILGYFINLIIIIFLKIVRQWGKEKYSRIIVVLMMTICIGLVGTLMFFHEGSILNDIFSAKDEGNNVRIEQTNIALNEITILGNGLGATFNDYVRNNEFPYAIEVVFVNLFHKFGIFALFALGLYLYVICVSMKNIINYHKEIESVFSITLLSFLYPSLGNPYLYSPLSVILHCISIYLLVGNEIDYIPNVFSKQARELK